MTIEVKVPVLPESIADATIVTWHKKPGDFVARDENIVDIETDKVMLEVSAPTDGTLTEIIEGEGTTVLAQQLIGKIDETQVAAQSTEAPQESLQTKDAIMSQDVVEKTDQTDLSPAVRRLVKEHGLDTSKIAGTGKAGRLTKEDIKTHLEQSTVGQTAKAQKTTIGEFAGPRPEQRVPMTRLRARVAERLVQAQHDAAMLTTFNEVNMHAVKTLRAEYKESFAKKHGVRLGFMSFFVKAVVEALSRFPAVNASIDGKDIIYHGYYDIGVAVSTERGLVVPILRDAEKLTMADIEAGILDFAERARQNKITIEEMTGGTFTVTNGGVFGSLLSTPILNPPQVAILGMHKIEERPVVENGQVVVRPMMYLALTYDHRIIDGKESVQFLVTIKELLEDPARLLLEV